MCERYFIEFPPQEPVTPDSILEESLALLQPKDIKLHHSVFFLPFEPRREQPDKKRIWSTRGQRSARNEAAAVLRHNIRYMIKKTKHFGLLLSQLTWVGLLNFAEKRRVLQHDDDNLGAAALYMIMLKKETSGLTQFINCLHMTGNHEIANVIEAKLELLVEKFGYCEHPGQCTVSLETSLDEWHGHSLPPKKRKTSADSGFDDTDDEDNDNDEADDDEDSDEQEIESSLAAHVAPRRYKCNIKPLDAVDVIAIINGKEDSRSKVELCKCGHYHQFPKWKDVNNDRHASVTKENVYSISSSSISSESSFAKYFSRRSSSDKGDSGKCQPQKSILSPVTQPVEMGSDLRNGVSQDLEFTQPRRSCPQLRLRFSNTNGFAEHPDNIEEEDEEVSSSGESSNKSLKSRLPRFLRLLF